MPLTDDRVMLVTGALARHRCRGRPAAAARLRPRAELRDAGGGHRRRSPPSSARRLRDALPVQADVGDEAVGRARCSARSTSTSAASTCSSTTPASPAGTARSTPSTTSMLARLWAVNVTGAVPLCTRGRGPDAHRPRRAWRSDRQHLVEGGRARRVRRVDALRRVEGRHRHDDRRAGQGARHRRRARQRRASRPHRERLPRPRSPGSRRTAWRPPCPMQRSGSADEVAGAVLWLAGPEASYVTGTFIDVSRRPLSRASTARPATHATSE